MRVVVFGLWHLGCVTAACVASSGHRVVGLDLDAEVVARLGRGEPPIEEPGLAELIAKSRDCLSWTSDPASALADADVLWVTFDTPVNERDEADVDFVREKLEKVRDLVRPGTLVLISSQVPVGFTRRMAQEWAGLGSSFAYSPENLRLGNALATFRNQERAVVGLGQESDRSRVEELLRPFAQRVEWMSIESAEMTKHAINAFLATSVCFINELARLCERIGADAREVERGLKSEGRIGPKAYLSPGPAFAGGTLARDLQFLSRFGKNLDVATPLFDGVLASNGSHKLWLRDKIAALLAGHGAPVVAVLGLTYKPGTSTLRRSASLELCAWLHERACARVKAHDPAVHTLPAELARFIELCETPAQALAGADLVVLATPWPEYRSLPAATFVTAMRRPRVLDEGWFLARELAGVPNLRYFAPGRASDG